MVRSSQKRSRPVSSPRSSQSAHAGGRPFFQQSVEFLIAGLLAIVLCWIYWWPLLTGGGLVGGDIYPYYFPQKTYLADSLKAGTVPLWNNLVGFGYPVLGESQTGALYPPHLILYGLLDTERAYHWNQILHYLFAFAGSYLLAKQLGLRPAGALLATLTLVFGWFPPRICLEWAIIGGAWYVWILYAGTAYLQSGQRRYLAMAAVSLGLSLLAGHYHLAFIALLTCLPLPWLTRPAPFPPDDQPSPSGVKSLLGKRAAWLGAALGVGFFLAAAQLLPTMELKSLSQRKGVNEVFSPTYGQLPPLAISQLWMPWSWYGQESSTDTLLAASRFLAVPAATNQVEAQLYLGIIPLILAGAGLLRPGLRKDLALKSPWGWGGLIIISLIMATGWPSYWMPWLPGLNFFRGAGRYSLVAALAVALLAGATLDLLLRRRYWTSGPTTVVVSMLLAFTTADLWAASRQYQLEPSPFWGRNVFYALMLDRSALSTRHTSALHKYFQDKGPGSRLYAPGQNIPTILGVSALPVYLGLGPELYESELMKFDFAETDPQKIADMVHRLRRFGVTHLLLESPLETDIWPVKDRGTWTDSLLNPSLARREPYYLYEITDSPGRVSLNPGSEKGNVIRNIRIEPNRVVVDVDCRTDCQLVLRDLDFPGWKINNTGLQQIHHDEFFRAVNLKASDSPSAIRVEWSYRPASFLYGVLLSLLGAVALGVMLTFAPRLNRHSPQHSAETPAAGSN